ncbi:MAG: type II toxin-antitoxin system HicB family antitoxin [Planctomycetes bacterium]|nr:type II toxin-antitoxin system HicB family antitoxin [Planctomycetia bacterium]MBI3464090.1 type II toxin-antitoxin system HicB family antitoxin [Planctomycetota bacterium]
MAIVREDDGRVSVIVLNLPGVGSCGDTEDEAIANAREAIRATLETYIEDKEEIPWVDSNSASVPDGAKLKWILVNV